MPLYNIIVLWLFSRSSAFRNSSYGVSQYGKKCLLKPARACIETANFLCYLWCAFYFLLILYIYFTLFHQPDLSTLFLVKHVQCSMITLLLLFILLLYITCWMHFCSLSISSVLQISDTINKICKWWWEEWKFTLFVF